MTPEQARAQLSAVLFEAWSLSEDEDTPWLDVADAAIKALNLDWTQAAALMSGEAVLLMPDGTRISRDRDIILEALNTYDEWMKDDDFQFSVILHKIIDLMRDRAPLAASPASEKETPL